MSKDTYKTPMIDIRHLSTYFDGYCVHSDINLSLYQYEISAIVGGSGCGKSTLLREILMLQKPTSGDIYLAGQRLHSQQADDMPPQLRRNIGVMFQHGALFSSLTVLQNIALPLELYTELDQTTINDIALLKMTLVGLSASAATKLPAELSGGMIKRAAIARALALDPALLFLDEPTAGLDPEGASAFEALLLELREALSLTIVMVTHDLDTLANTADRIAFLGEGQVLAVGSMRQLLQSSEPLVQAYFANNRAKRVLKPTVTTEL